jgi:hypothetical protein
MTNAIDEAKRLLAAAEQKGGCTGFKAGRDYCPGCSADAALSLIMERGKEFLRVLIITAEALREDGHDSQKYMCLVGRTVPLEKASCSGCTALAEFEKLFPKEVQDD